MPMWLGSQMKLIFLLYLQIKSKIYVRRFGLLILLPEDITFRELYESLNMQLFC